MRKKLLAELKKKEKDKIMLSFQTNKRYKDMFERVCKHESYSMTSVLNGLLKLYVNDFLEDEYKKIRPLIKKGDMLLDEHEINSEKHYDNKSSSDDFYFAPSQELLDFREVYVKEYLSLFSVTDDEGSVFIPYENDIDNLGSSNHSTTVYGSLLTVDKKY